MMTNTETEEMDRAPDTATTHERDPGCCGGAAPSGADACCALDAHAKSAGLGGCGCASKDASKGRTGCC
jgi:hypothetical protein